MGYWGLCEDSQESNSVLTVYSTGFTNQLTDNETSPTGYEGTSTVCSLSVVNIKRQCTTVQGDHGDRCWADPRFENAIA